MQEVRIEWVGWEMVLEPGEITWVKNPEYKVEDCVIRGKRVAFLTKRPGYCDRGHWQVNSELPGLDGADGFPRYYMEYEVAKEETERWLKWRLWQQRG